MKKYSGWLGMLAILGAVAGVYVATEKKPERRPPEAAAAMEFPNGADFIGDPFDGSLCHQVILRVKGKPERVLKSHRIMDHDFRTGTPEDKKRWIIEDTLKDFQETGMACAQPPDRGWLHLAYAQPQCEDCGGGCVVISCPAHVVQGGACYAGGGGCVLTIMCCGGGGCSCG